MPISYEIDKENRVVVCTLSGFCTADEAWRFHKQLSSDNNFDSEFSQLVDTTGVTGTDVTPARLRVVAETDPFSSSSRRAFVAGTQFGFGLARVYEIARSVKGDTQVHVFHDRQAALEWLLEKDRAA